MLKDCNHRAQSTELAKLKKLLDGFKYYTLHRKQARATSSLSSTAYTTLQLIVYKCVKKDKLLRVNHQSTVDENCNNIVFL